MVKLIILLIATLTSFPLQAKPLRVLIDPGHGGNDRGTNQKSITEKKITLEVSKRIQKLLKKDDRFISTLTRSKDKNLSLFKRAEIARSEKADVLLSIHVNSSSDKNAKGAEFYIINQLPPEEESQYLAYKENNNMNDASRIKNWPLRFVEGYQNLGPNVQNILHDLTRVSIVRSSSELAKSLMFNWSGIKKSKKHSIKQAPFYVIANVNVPAVLVELGFLTNKREAKLLQKPQYQEKLAKSIVNGLVEYKKRLNKYPNSHLY